MEYNTGVKEVLVRKSKPYFMKLEIFGLAAEVGSSIQFMKILNLNHIAIPNLYSCAYIIGHYKPSPELQYSGIIHIVSAAFYVRVVGPTAQSRFQIAV